MKRPGRRIGRPARLTPGILAAVDARQLLAASRMQLFKATLNPQDWHPSAVRAAKQGELLGRKSLARCPEVIEALGAALERLCEDTGDCDGR